MKTGSAFPSLTKRQDSKKLTSTTANSGNATPPTVQTGTAKMWRKDLADTINATNEQLGITLHWEHRSFKEQGIDREPTIHIGAVANALERKGRLDLPIVSGKYLRKISDRTALQSADNAGKFITTRKIGKIGRASCRERVFRAV